MKIRNPRSIAIILVYLGVNTGILLVSFTQIPDAAIPGNEAKSIRPDPTLIENLDYFFLKNGVPEMSLAATLMNSQGETFAEFESPKGVYSYQQKKESIRYQGLKGLYRKDDEMLILEKAVKITSSDSQYFADHVQYFYTKDLVIGMGNVKFIGDDLKSKDHIEVTSDNMRAHPEQRLGTFSGDVKGSMTRKKQYEGKTDFASRQMQLDGNQSLAHLEEDVWIHRGPHVITSGKADFYLENYNKSLKYFVLNDDVKVTEKLSTPEGVTERKSFSERLEGFGQEQKMILSGAPRVETGSDVIKGYRITIRENVDLIEVDDSMSDVKVKREEKENN